jgi:type II secretory pathway pseudopilin PulG
MRLWDIRGISNNEAGVSLIETLVAVAILGFTAVIFFGGVSSSSQGVYIADERATAESLARTQMEWAKNATYTTNATQYSPAPIPAGKDYLNYSANITAAALHATDDGIQEITVTIKHSGKDIITLEGYKSDR